MIMLSMTLDNELRQAECTLGATLHAFLVEAGCSLLDNSLLSDGQRSLRPSLELAYRFNGAVLSTEIPTEMLMETPALLADDLMVPASSSNR